MQGDLHAWLAAASGTDEEFVDRIWPLVLRRPPEADGRERALAKLREGTLSRAGLLHELAESDERAIEIPWSLARYRGEQRVLDIGYAFAEPAYLAGLAALGAAELVGA